MLVNDYKFGVNANEIHNYKQYSVCSKLLSIIRLKAFWLVLVILPRILYAQQNELGFENLNTQNGLENSIVKDITQDESGFIWIATGSGLCRYDGYNFKTFSHKDDDTSSIVSNFLIQVKSDQKGSLWISSLTGLDCMNLLHNKITHYFEGQEINSIKIDYNKDVWAFINNAELWHYKKIENVWQKIDGKLMPFNANKFSVEQTPDNSLLILNSRIIKYNPQNGVINTYKVLVERGHEYNGIINSIIPHEYDKNKVWVANNLFGLSLLDTVTRKIVHYPFIPSKIANSTENSIIGILRSPHHLFWLATENFGLLLFDPQKCIYLPKQSETLNTSLKARLLSCIFQDKSNTLWLGSYKEGLYKADLYSKNFANYTLPNVHKPSASQIITSFLEDGQNLWIGSWDGGLFRYNTKTKVWNRYIAEDGNSKALGSNQVGDICADKHGNIWILSWYGVISFMPARTKNSKTPTFYNFKYSNDTSHKNTLNAWGLRKLICDSSNNLWVSSFDMGIFCMKVSMKGEIPIIEYTYPKNICSKTKPINGWTLFECGNTLLIGSDNTGMVLFDKTSGKISTYISQLKDTTTLCNNSVRVLFKDSRSRLWVGTANGICQFFSQKGCFKRYSRLEGIHNNVVYGILEDDKGFLWLSTDHGLFRFDTEKETVREYNQGDGLPSDEFSIGAFYKLNNGNLLFGTNKGFTQFSASKIIDNPITPSVVLTDLKLYNKTVKIDTPYFGSVILNKDINYVEKITLNYRQNDFTVEFSATHFANPKSNRYFYKLEGFENSWIEVSWNRRFAAFTNLSAGNYRLHIKATNNDGLFGNEKILVITVLPPWWKSIYARVIYFLLAFFLIFIYFNFRLRREKQRHNIQIERLNHRKTLEMNEAKLRFFTNISHELRTPLTLIISPLQHAIKTFRLEPELHNHLALAFNNSNRLMQLITQLLDFRKMEEGELKLNKTNNDISLLVKNICQSFYSLAMEKKVSLNCNCTSPTLLFEFDTDKFEKIVSNLLSNAIKNTPPNGSINVTLRLDGEKAILIKVADTGIGIPKESVGLIFNRFYRVPGSNNAQKVGSGIGLSLTRELVQMHGGIITVESEVGIGTTFSVEFPYIKPILLTNKVETYAQELFEPAYTNTDDESTGNLNQNRKTILVVEDNADLRNYLISILKTEYSILEATEGQTGFDITIGKLPDLVVSDIMMEPVDGLELCKNIKNSEEVSHIPVIMLTALSSDQTKLMGIETGADDFIVKPFNSELLLARVAALIEGRRKLAERYRTEIHRETLCANKQKVSNSFLEKATITIEKHLSDSNFGVKELAEKLNMSQVHFYRKLQQLVNQAPGDFIRDYRLKRAAELLMAGQLNINQVVDTVGFSYPSYFARCFKERFGKTPSEYIKK